MYFFPQKVTPSVPTLYTNCALCNLKLGRWTQVIEDCQKVEQLDSSVIKSHFFKGQALVELGKYDEAIVNLKKGVLNINVKLWVFLNARWKLSSKCCSTFVIICDFQSTSSPLI